MVVSSSAGALHTESEIRRADPQSRVTVPPEVVADPQSRVTVAVAVKGLPRSGESRSRSRGARRRRWARGTLHGIECSPCRSGGSGGAVLRLGTDFSGLEVPSMALHSLGVEHSLVFASERNAILRAFIIDNFKPGMIFDDISLRPCNDSSASDVYIAGTPCQPFSSLGLREGTLDIRGRLMDSALEYVCAMKPSVFILENVPGMRTSNKGKLFASILDRLDALGCYNVHWQCLDTLQHGLAQRRVRLYIVGLLRSNQVHAFTFPAAIASVPLELLLDARSPCDDPERRPPASQASARAIVSKELQLCKDDNLDLWSEDRILDVDCSAAWALRSANVAPTLTSSRRSGLWLVSRGRRLTARESLRLQGIAPDLWNWTMTDRERIGFAGNAMSVNVITRLLAAALPAVALSRFDPAVAGVAVFQREGGDGLEVPSMLLHALGVEVPGVVEPCRRRRWARGTFHGLA